MNGKLRIQIYIKSFLNLFLISSFLDLKIVLKEKDLLGGPIPEYLEGKNLQTPLILH
jgi:hypothetical protein